MILLAALALFVAVIAVRTIRFTPKPQPAVSEETFELNEDAVIDALAKLVRCKTISYNEQSSFFISRNACYIYDIKIFQQYIKLFDFLSFSLFLFRFFQLLLICRHQRFLFLFSLSSFFAAILTSFRR